MDSCVSWNTQPEHNNLSVVSLVGRIGAFTAQINGEVMEVGSRLIGHEDSGYGGIALLGITGNDEGLAGQWAVLIFLTRLSSNNTHQTTLIKPNWVSPSSSIIVPDATSLSHCSPLLWNSITEAWSQTTGAHPHQRSPSWRSSPDHP